MSKPYVPYGTKRYRDREVVRNVRHSTVSLHRVRLLFFFTCLFINAYILGTSMP